MNWPLSQREAATELIRRRNVRRSLVEWCRYCRFEPALHPAIPAAGRRNSRASKTLRPVVTSRDRVEKLKSAGKSAQEAVAEKPFADLDTMWGKGIINSEQWVQIVYLTL
jgi:hypothetical protein